MDFEAFETAMADLEEDTLLEMAEEAAAMGKEGANAAVEACQRGMQTVGERFEEGEYFIGDLVYAGEIMGEVMDILQPILATGDGSGAEPAKLVLATVKGDLHDIGKNIVKAMLQAAGFDVIDLGVDVAPEAIVKCAQETGAKIVALSGVLTLSIESMKNTVAALDAAGLRPGVHVIIGGNPVSEEACTITGADAWAHSPAKTIEVCKGWVA